MISAVVFTEKEIILSCGIYSKNKPKIKKQKSLAYPVNSYVNGEILDCAALSSAISHELKKEKMKGKSLILGIQHPQVNIVELSVPYVKGKIMQAVNVKLSERFIGITEENYISYKMCKLEGNMCHGMASIVPHKVLEQYYELSMKIGLPLHAIDYMGNIFYKNMHLEEPKLAKETFIIAETDFNEVYAHLYHDGGLKSTRNENGSQIFVQDELNTDDFVFQSKLSFTDEDIEQVTALHKKVKQGIEDMSAVLSTIGIFYQRYKADSEEKDIEDATDNSLKRVDESLADIRLLCSRSLDFDESMQKNTQKIFQELSMRLQKLNTELKNIEQVQSSFTDGIKEILVTIKLNVEESLEIFAKYVMNEVDQKKFERRAMMQSICKTVNHVISVADMSQDYQEISVVYIQGMLLDANEKKLMEQNLSKNYVIEVRNYEAIIPDLEFPYLGIYYNDFTYFKDLDLASTLEKNDKINRNNYDNIILGVGGCLVFGVVCIFGLWGYTQYDMYQMKNNTVENERYISENKSIDLIVSKEKKLRENIEEIEKFQEYFSVAKVNMSEIYNELAGMSNDVEIADLSIDSNFTINMKLRSPTLQAVSEFMESITKKGYGDAAYDTVVMNDGKYEVSAHYKFTPKGKKG